ncbi:hypothetical protein EOM75_00610 [Candidatus Falkowbacteria bacterium]|nr:hypothetical protein [Candidatus Falkowbacteria bacterium]
MLIVLTNFSFFAPLKLIKKYLFKFMKYLIMSFVGIAFVFAIFSCNKIEEQLPQNFDENVTSRKLERLIISFHQNVKNKSFKSYNQFSVDSAIWYTESTENYINAKPYLSHEQSQMFATSYQVPLNQNGAINSDEVENLYLSMENELTSCLELVEGDDKELCLTDVVLDSLSANTAFVTINRVITSKYILRSYLAFQPGEDWIWGTLSEQWGNPLAGKCDGTEVGVSDASNELMWRLNNPEHVTQPYIFTDIEAYSATGFEYDNRLYTGWNYPEQNCLIYDLLNYYLKQSHYIMKDDSEGLKPVDKDFVHVEIVDEVVVGRGQYFHYYTVCYGKKLLVSPSPL